MSAPSEAEIRAAIEAAWTAEPLVGPSAASEFLDGFAAAEGLLDGLWDVENFLPAEFERFADIVDAAVEPIHDAARNQVTEALVRAGVQFAAEFPGAPRASGRPAA
jgi:hypothetical protein